jgi:adenosylcobyric acid synthase
VTSDGDEIGRAQAAQARAARLDATVQMNPVLLKPGNNGCSQVVVLGHPIGERGAGEYQRDKGDLLGVVAAAFEQLAAEHDVVLAEGAGSVAEINLRKGDLVNFGLARAVGAPVVVVGDIDRGGVFAAFIGTLAALDLADAALLRGFIVNRFRGDASLLTPAIDDLRGRTGRSLYGVIPEQIGLELDAEDSLAAHPFAQPVPPLGSDVLRIGVVDVPHLSNLTDVDPLALEPGVIVRMLRVGEEVADVDIVILPGSRAVVSDLEWCRQRRFDGAIRDAAGRGTTVIGICGGYQMLGSAIEDHVESSAGRVEALGLLAVSTQFDREKVLRRHSSLVGRMTGYEIRHGQVNQNYGAVWFEDEGTVEGAVMGTSWHGVFENDEFRRALLASAAERAGREFVVSESVCFSAVRERYYELLADLVDEHLDVDSLLDLASSS